MQIIKCHQPFFIPRLPTSAAFQQCNSAPPCDSNSEVCRTFPCLKKASHHPRHQEYKYKSNFLHPRQQIFYRELRRETTIRSLEENSPTAAEEETDTDSDDLQKPVGSEKATEGQCATASHHLQPAEAEIETWGATSTKTVSSKHIFVHHFLLLLSAWAAGVPVPFTSWRSALAEWCSGVSSMEGFRCPFPSRVD